MPLFENNLSPYLTIVEATEPSAPAAGQQRLYIDSTTHLLKATNSSGTDRTIESSGTTTIATDTIWAAAGDLVQATGNDAAAVLSAGTAGYLLTAHGAAAALTWAAPPVLATARSTADITTTSTSFTDLTGMTATITTLARRVLVTFSCGGIYNSGGNYEVYTLLVDGTNVGGATAGLMTISTGGSGSTINGGGFTFLTDALSAGSHTIKVQWKVSAGTGHTDGTLGTTTFSVMEQFA